MVKPGIGTPAASAAATLTTAVAETAGGELSSAADCSAADCSVACSPADDSADAFAAADRFDAAAAADADAAAPESAAGGTATAGVDTAGMLVLVLPLLSGAAVVHAVSAIAVATATSTARIPIVLTCLTGGGCGYLDNVPPGNNWASDSSLTLDRGSGNDEGPCTRDSAGQAVPEKIFPAPREGVEQPGTPRGK